MRGLRHHCLITAVALVAGIGLPLTAVTPASATPVDADKFTLTKIAGYSTGAAPNADGGIAEIVGYNADNSSFYVVNGSTTPACLEVVPLPKSGYGATALDLAKSTSIDVQALLATKVPGFTYGDLTSVAIDTVKDRVYVAVQEADFARAGVVLALDYDGGFIRSYQAGVQPDMVTVSEDGRYVLSADEGEPRDGVIANDPPGTVTIIDTTANTTAQVGFADTTKIDDAAHIRGVERDPATDLMLARDKSAAVTDFEPEYITIQGNLAYVTLQENNAVATVSIANPALVAVHGLGSKNVSRAGNEADLLRDGEIDIDNYPAKMLYQPDGIASYRSGGKSYLFTANEGDVSEFIDNSLTVDKIAPYLTNKIAKAFWSSVADNPGDVAADMSDLSAPYFFGARSFSVWDASDLSQVYDSGSDFERITAERLPGYFNISNDKYKTSDSDKRSGKKGPEPENVVVGTIGARSYAFVGLERIGGVMAYDVTDPTKPTFASYVNTREFVSSLGGDNSPEGLDFVPASQSPTGKALLLASFEVGGTVAVYEIGADPKVAASMQLRVGRMAFGGTPSQVQATVTGAGKAATGTVAFTVDGRVLATVSLRDGVAIAKLPAGLNAGKVKIAAKYSGDEQTEATAASTVLTVSKATTKTTVKLAKSKVKRLKQVLATVVVSVNGGAKVVPSGSIWITRNGRVVATGKLHKGRTTIKIPAGVRSGTYRISARYLGSSNLVSSSSGIRRLKVTWR